jgi:hypothetical protein
MIHKSGNIYSFSRSKDSWGHTVMIVRTSAKGVLAISMCADLNRAVVDHPTEVGHADGITEAEMQTIMGMCDVWEFLGTFPQFQYNLKTGEIKCTK